MRRQTANGAASESYGSFSVPRLYLLRTAIPASLWHVAMPYKVATLLYCFNEADQVLLMHRTQEPNLGLWSPCGGKLDMASGESPYACACREAAEELGLKFRKSDFHLTGLASEHGYAGQAHWLMFLFELQPRLKRLPAQHREGIFRFFKREELNALEVPKTDLEQIWPLFWKHRGGFFAAHCRCSTDGTNEWQIEESIPARK